MLSQDLNQKIDSFIEDPGLKIDKVNRSLFIRDVLKSVFDDFEKKGKKSILEKLYPEE
ncbi:MAG: hypothetical protein ABIA56_05245 [Actinomycetota bacterium]